MKVRKNKRYINILKDKNKIKKYKKFLNVINQAIQNQYY